MSDANDNDNPSPPPFERIERLLALGASDANDAEARNAAVQACRLVKEHHLSLKKKQPWDGWFTEEEMAAAWRGVVLRKEQETPPVVVEAHEDEIERLFRSSPSSRSSEIADLRYQLARVERENAELRRELAELRGRTLR